MLTSMAQIDLSSIEAQKAEAQFLADHPAVAKIIQPQQRCYRLPTFPLPGVEALAAKPLNTSRQNAANLPVIWSNMVSSDLWTGRYDGKGIYSYNPVSPIEFTLIAKQTGTRMNGNGGGVRIGDRYYIVNWETASGSIFVSYYVYDTNTWQIVSQKEFSDGGICATDLAYDRLNDVCYGAFFRDDLRGYELATVKYGDDRPVKTRIGDLPFMVVSLGVNSKGELYGVCEDGVLYRFDPTDASATKIGDTGIKVSTSSGVHQMSGEFDMHTDTFYWATRDVYGECTLYTIDTATAEVTAVASIPDHSQLLNMQIMAPIADDKAPGYITNLNVSFPNGSLSGEVGFTVPDAAFDGSTLGTDLTAVISVNGEEKSKFKVQAGEKVNRELTYTQGEAFIEVWIANEAGKSPVESTSLWVGQDYPVITSVTYTADGINSTVTWETAEKGLHGGFVGTPHYNVVRMPDNKQVATDITTRKVSDILPENQSATRYSYLVTAFVGDIMSDPVESNRNVIGIYDTPYLATFDTEEDLNVFSFIDVDKDGNTWGWDIESMAKPQGVACSDNSSDDEIPTMIDDWMLTPEIRLSAGHEYKLTFKAMNWNTEPTDKLIVAYGNGTDVSKYVTLIPNAIYGTKFKENEASFKSKTDQIIRIGFRRTAEWVNGVTLKIDDISLSDEGTDASPAGVTDLNVSPDSEGDLIANVSFTTPTTDRAGNVLSDLTKAEIFVGTQLAATIDKPETGKSYEREIDVPSNGEHTFRVDIYNSAGQGVSKSIKQFVGEDIPGSFKIKAVDGGDHIAIQWDECSVGLNGNYVNPDRMTYDVYQVIDEYPEHLLAQNLSDCEFIIDYDTNSGPVGGITFCVQAKNSAGASPYYTSNPCIVGTPYELPYEEHFDGTSPYQYDGEFSDYFNISTGQSSDGDNGCFTWLPIVDGNRSSRALYSLKINIDDAANPTLTFDYRMLNGNSFEVYGVHADYYSETLLGTVTEGTAAVSTDTEWLTARIDLSPMKGNGYFRFKIVFKKYAEGGFSNFMINLDNLRVFDKVDHNLTVSLEVPANKPKYGESPMFIAKVANMGQETAGDYKVSLYAGNELVETQNGTAGLEFTQSTEHRFSYKIPVGTPETLEIKAVVEYPSDELPDDNTASVVIDVQTPKVSTPENLKGEASETGVQLSWNAPEEFYTETVCESWEDYTPWTITNIGDWTLVDVDGAPVIGLEQADYPNESKPQAFTIFNPISIGMPETNTEGYPHDGYQYLACFAADINTVEHNDDWIISPMLSGEAQTIEFYAKHMSSYYVPEKLQVLASDTSKDIEDFTSVQEFEIANDINWNKYSTTLPEGALYFALRVVTSDGHICMIDDITFIAGSCKDIEAYRIYRNGQLIGEVPSSQLTYPDANASNGSRYNVTAVYATGEESAFSNDWHYNVDGVNEPCADSRPVTYTVYGIDGRLIMFEAPSLGTLQSGFYIVNGQKIFIQ